MTFEQIVTIVAGLGGPAVGLIIALIVDRRTKRNTDSNNEVAVMGLSVDERDAHTREVAMIIEGFTSSLDNAKEDLKEAKTDLRLARDELIATRLENKGLRTEVSHLTQRVEDVERAGRTERQALLDHITKLETLIPTPPGPPERPAWLKTGT